MIPHRLLRAPLAQRLAAVVLLGLSTACGTPSAQRVEQRLGSMASSLRRPLQASTLHTWGSRVDELTGDTLRLAAAEVGRLGALRDVDAARHVGPRVQRLIAATSRQVATLSPRTRRLASHADLHALPARPFERASRLASALRKTPKLLGFEHQPLADRSDWVRRLDPSDLTPPAGFGERILRRLGW